MRGFKTAALLLFMCCILPGCSQTEKDGRAVNGYVYLEDKTSYVLENDALKLELDPATTYVTVTDKRNQTKWSSNPEAAAKDGKADGENKNLLQSTLSVEYSTTEGINATLNNFEYSIEKGLYEIEEGDGYVKVNYNIGNIGKTFMIPRAMTESRMNGYLEKMTASGQKQVKEYYRKYDINALRSSDSRDELLAQYPELQTECVYALREGLQDYLQRKLEDLFEEAGYTAEEFEKDQEQYSNEGGRTVPVFDVSLVYRLDGDDLTVEVPFEDLAWTASYPMTKLTLLPYMGAGSEEEDGFLLVPEGPGGVIAFNNGKTKQSAYYADVYGWDLAQNRTSLVDESRTAYPVFAVSKGSGAMMCMIEESPSLATIEADISGRNNSYNFAHATYRILHNESLDVSAKSDKSVVAFESGLPEGRVLQRYRFLEEGGYDQMAVSYREYLTERYPWLEKQQDGQAPVMVSLIGAVDEVKQKFGFPMSVPVPLTTYEEAQEILQDLMDRGYENLYVRYSGWMNGGVTHSLPKKVKTVSELGSRKELQQTAEYAAANGIRFYLEGGALQAYQSGRGDGFSLNRDSARYASREVAEIPDYSPVWYGADGTADSHYLLKPQLGLQMMDSLAAAARTCQAGVAYSDVGYLLGADYNSKNHVSRQAAADMEARKLAERKEAGQGIMLRYGNDYAVAYADAVTDMDLTGKQYAVIDRFVPFYPMALHGLVSYAGTPVNLSGDYTQTVLQSAELGAGLSFTFMKESAATLQESSYTRYFGADYSLWAETAAAVTNRYQQELGHCFGQYMTTHEMVADGVAMTGYEDGTAVYVNYNNTEYRGAGIVVPARDYLVVRR